MRPYIVQQDGHTNPNLWGATEADRPPTSSPPLEFLRGAVDLRIFNNGSADIPVRLCFSKASVVHMWLLLQTMPCRISAPTISRSQPWCACSNHPNLVARDSLE